MLKLPAASHESKSTRPGCIDPCTGARLPKRLLITDRLIPRTLLPEGYIHVGIVQNGVRHELFQHAALEERAFLHKLLQQEGHRPQWEGRKRRAVHHLHAQKDPAADFHVAPECVLNRRRRAGAQCPRRLHAHHKLPDGDGHDVLVQGEDVELGNEAGLRPLRTEQGGGPCVGQEGPHGGVRRARDALDGFAQACIAQRGLEPTVLRHSIQRHDVRDVVEGVQHRFAGELDRLADERNRGLLHLREGVVKEPSQAEGIADDDAVDHELLQTLHLGHRVCPLSSVIIRSEELQRLEIRGHEALDGLHLAGHDLQELSLNDAHTVRPHQRAERLKLLESTEPLGIPSRRGVQHLRELPAHLYEANAAILLSRHDRRHQLHIPRGDTIDG
mmetsp:Transcript_12393/g.45834  ORF Transcript_12393/g.45834 Transcript_12393/m.45834 type:complete len:387 (-) Transcript_12393:1503-2663(-)